MRELIITRGGQQLAAQFIAGAGKIEFTRLAASDHDYSDADISELSELSGVRQSALIPSVKRTGGSVVQLMAAMDNRELSEGYFVRAVGVFVRGSDGGELLFAVSLENDAPFFMPPFSGKTVSSVTYRLDVKVSCSENVVFAADPAAYVTVEQLGLELAQKADIAGLPSSLPANGGNADTVGGAAVTATAALGLHRMSSGAAAATASNCPSGCWYGQYE